MEIRADFLEWLGPDASTNVFHFLDDPADTVRLTAVSPSWRRFVISNGCCKKLCLRKCAGLPCFTRVIEETTANMTADGTKSSCDTEWENLENEHRVYSYLSRCLLKPYESDFDLISEAIRASSTDNNFTQSGSSDIERSMYSDDKSCWSSKGEKDPEMPETLIYRLGSRFCIVNEITVQPFEAYFQPGNPIYSAKAVRFRMGHSLLDPDEDLPYPSPSSKRYRTNALYGSDREFVWTYVSPEFPMAQRNELQRFKLPCPALCIGGFLQVELLGRVQVHPTDKLYHICICNVEVIGHPPYAFGVDIDLDSGRSVLQYYPRVADDNHIGFSAHVFDERVMTICSMRQHSEDDMDF